MAKKGAKKRPIKATDPPADLSQYPSPFDILAELAGMSPRERDALLDSLGDMLGALTDDLAAGPPLLNGPKRGPGEAKVVKLVERAQQQSDPGAAAAILLQAEQAARAALGRRFEQLAGDFAGHPSTQLYLDVKVALIEALAAAGDSEQAIAHCEEALALASDDFTIFDLLLSLYLRASRDVEADKLLYEDLGPKAAATEFARLLLDLRQGKKGKATDAQLRRAHRSNRRFLSYVLSYRVPGGAPPIGLTGDKLEEEEEAVLLASRFLPAWRETPGAITWLRDAVARLGIDAHVQDEFDPLGRTASRAPSPAQVRRFPLHAHATWVAGARELGPMPVPGGGKPRPAWLVFAFSDSGELVQFAVEERRPTAKSLWRSLVDFMQDESSPGRPERILVQGAELQPQVQALAQKAGIETSPYAGESLDKLLDAIVERMHGSEAGARKYSLETLQAFPQRPEAVWEAAVSQVGAWLNAGPVQHRPALALVYERASGALLWHEMFLEPPPPGALSNAIRMAIARPVAGEPYRPGLIMVRDPDEQAGVEPLLSRLGIACETESQLPLVDRTVAEMASNASDESPSAPAVMRAEGITHEDAERFFTAAAAFFQARCWRSLLSDEVIRVDPLQGEGAARYALVMGQSGVTLGVAVYDRLADIATMFGGPERPPYCTISVQFAKNFILDPVDLDAIDQFGWPVAAPEAYPFAAGMDAEGEGLPIAADEIRLLTAILEGVTQLVAARSKNVEIAGPRVSIKLTRAGRIDDLDFSNG